MRKKRGGISDARTQGREGQKKVRERRGGENGGGKWREGIFGRESEGEGIDESMRGNKE